MIRCKKFWNNKKIIPFALLTSSFLLTACGGSSSSSSGSSGTAESASINGTAAVGAAITDAEVTAKCQDGSGLLANTVTDEAGQFTGSVSEDALPCALRVTHPDGTPYHSLATGGGTVNITPLTDLAIALSGVTPTQWYDSRDIAATAGVLDQRKAELVAQMEGKGYTIPENFDPFRNDFTIGDAHDQILDDLGEAIQDTQSIESHQALVVLVRDGNLGLIPAAPNNNSSIPLPGPNQGCATGSDTCQ